VQLELEKRMLDPRCAAEPMYWLQNHTRTENEKHLEQGLPFRAPFPVKRYLEIVMLTSWLAMGLPSGFREQALTDFDAARARGFDENLVQALFANEQAKSEAARLLTGQQQIANPLGYYGGAQQGYNSILQAQSLVKPGIGGFLGGLANTALRKINLGSGFPTIGG
jgi:hypothetical protein